MALGIRSCRVCNDRVGAFRIAGWISPPRTLDA